MVEAARRGVALAALLCGCGPPRLPPAAPTTGAWRTHTAEHRVALDYEDASGKREQRSLRGVIAVERPGRFRLRALGPGGIALFDLLYLDGEVRVVKSLRDAAAGESAFGRIVRGMARDLALAYGLAPRPPGLVEAAGGGRITLRDGERTVTLSDFVAVGRDAAPARITIDDRALHYRAVVEAHDIRLDEPLDPRLFTAE